MKTVLALFVGMSAWSYFLHLDGGRLFGEGWLSSIAFFLAVFGFGVAWLHHCTFRVDYRSSSRYKKLIGVGLVSGTSTGWLLPTLFGR